MDFIFYVKSTILVLSAGVLFVLLLCFIEGVRILSRFRRIAERIELLTDIKGWFLFLRKFSRSSKKKAD
ncbi:hypothetical protein ACFLZV_01880 [Candidatus Margulisiibacteriota bacterium]